MLRQTFNRVGLVVVLAAVTFGCLAVSAQADFTIYNDTFTRSGDLNGSSPDSTSGLGGGTAGALWVAATAWQTNGTQAVLNGDRSGAILPFTPQANRVYTLSYDLNCNGGLAEGWMGTGFGASISPTWVSDMSPAESSGIAWFLERAPSYSGGTDRTYAIMGPGTAGIGPNYDISGLHSFSTVLDTTTALWSLQFKVDGVTKLTSAYTANPAIACILLGNDYATGTVDNLTLSVANVPEPGTVVLLAMGLVGLLAYAWRKRK
jgi:hypothetical protein